MNSTSASTPLLRDWRSAGVDPRTRTFSGGSIDPNEDPVSGLERVASLQNLRTRRRRRDLDDASTLASGRHGTTPGHMKDHALSEMYESLDYEIVENQLYRDEESMPQYQQVLRRQSMNRWLCAFLIGVVTALIAAAIDVAVSTSSKLKFDFMLRSLLSLCDDNNNADANRRCVWAAELAWICYNCGLVAIAASLVIFVSPVAAGSGIPQIKCFLNGIQIPGVVRLKTLVAKAVGVACSVSGGLAAGKEGPMIHSGAVVAAGISQGRCISLPFDLHIFEYFRNDREKRDFVSIGAAAGVAAAFGAPIGGVLFSLEEGASFWNQSLTWRMFFSAMISSFTLNFVLAWVNSPHDPNDLSRAGLANFGVFEETNYKIVEIPIFVLIGVLGGLFGALFNHLNTKLANFRIRFIKSRFQRLFEAILVAAMSAFTALVTIHYMQDCRPIGSAANITEPMRMYCQKGYFSSVAYLYISSPEESVKKLLHNPINTYQWTTLAVFAVEYFVLTLWTFGLAVPAGVFIPTLLTGAAWGRLVGITVHRMGMTTIDPGLYALAGAAAQLGGVVRMTISLTAIIVEATRNITFGLPIMLVLMVAKWIGDLFNPGLYDSHIELAEVPILGWHPPRCSRNILAERVMRKDVIAMEPHERVSRVLDVLRSTRHHGFPIVDAIEPPGATQYPEYGHLKGLILRSQLITLLQRRVFSYDLQGRRHVPGYLPTALSHFRDAYPRYNLDAIDVSREDGNCWIDLGPYMNPSPHRVPLNASLPFIFRIFRGLGLRYLMVVNDENQLRGIVTRKDVARFKEKRHQNSYFVRELYISRFQ